jgi:hypothetical protein
MRANQTYYPKPELVAKYPRIHKSITLLRQITEPHYAQKGQWVVELERYHSWTDLDLTWIDRQVFTEAQIESLFDTESERA